MNHSRRLLYSTTLLSAVIAGIIMIVPSDSPSVQKESITIQANASFSNQSVNIAKNTISENIAMEKKLDGNGDDRITYQPGFYYEPLTDAVKKRIYGYSYKKDCTIPFESLRYVSVYYKDFKNETKVGEIICNQAIADDLVEIFYELYQAEYPIGQIRLIDEFAADDDLSCLENNTSCFNYRVISGTTKLSKHAKGLAIDINPVYNPYVTYPNGEIHVSPEGSDMYADRNAVFSYKIDENDLCYQLFTAHGFTWGGNWKTLKDYQHFQK